ncbi:MAG TPA: 4Fe-4S binding protein, partial [Acidimicrobiales bacterium]|nr:4Fe-4S binding protein [Acidimicrobiales bacterium]
MADLGVNVEEGRRATAPLENGAVVLLCSDVVERRKSPLAPEEVGAALRRHCPGARVVVVPSLCSWSSDLLAILQSLGARRVVVGCSQGNAKRQKILGVVRSCGVHPAGAQVVDLAPGPGTGPKRLTEQSMARLRSALAGVSCADLGAPVHESTVPFSSVRVSRRGLFSFGYIVSRPVAGWSSELCAGHGPARPCTLACPHGALSVTGGRISVDQAVCTGCGACASACRSGAMSLTGTSIAALEASASALVEDARRLGLGVAIVCSKASATLELGGDWLELQVPSLNMVSVGWALQVVATGVGVTLVGCNDPGCGERARQVMSLSAIVVSEVAPRQRHLVVAWGCRLPAPPSAEGADAPSFDDGFRPSIALREPEATVRALSDLACRINELGGGP